MKTTEAFWQKKMVVALPLLLLSGSGPVFAGSDSLGCFDPKSGTDDGGDCSIEGDTDDGSVRTTMSPEDLAKFREWLFGDDINAPPPGGWPPGVGGLSGTAGTSGTTGTAGATGTAGSTGTAGTTGAAGSGAICSTSSGQCPTLPSCEDVRTTVLAHPAESVTRTQYRLNITF